MLEILGSQGPADNKVLNLGEMMMVSCSHQQQQPCSPRVDGVDGSLIYTILTSELFLSKLEEENMVIN